MKSAADQIAELPSYNWSLSLLCYLNGLHAVLEWNDNNPAYDFPGYNWISVHYSNPATWSHINIAKMWQHPPDDPSTTVYVVGRHGSNTSFVDDFTLNMECLNGQQREWILSRVTAWDDAIAVISEVHPIITLHQSEPPMMEWWNSGYSLRQAEG